MATRCAESVILDERIESAVCGAPIVQIRSIEVTAAALIDLDLFRFVDDPASALLMLQTGIAAEPEATTPAFAHSRTPPKESAEALAECP